ncbi:response regulator [Polluticoccus soli]|uniref:response regulator n=1 Tax=Polluticoccus soli TaxID=3034150 RepID=UPI0023E1199F|nr:response regulator [Flavipsychrobacter sp. JY13-12]
MNNTSGPILLIDDDLEEQEMLETAFREIGMDNKILFFKNGLEAMDHLLSATEKPFLILCDMNMPVMDGLTLRDNINSNDILRKKSIPFIFYSTTARPEEVEKAYELAVQGFFEKHFAYQEMCNDLRRICGYWASCIRPTD